MQRLSTGKQIVNTTMYRTAAYHFIQKAVWWIELATLDYKSKLFAQSSMQCILNSQALPELIKHKDFENEKTFQCCLSWKILKICSLANV